MHSGRAETTQMVRTLFNLAMGVKTAITCTSRTFLVSHVADKRTEPESGWEMDATTSTLALDQNHIQ